MCTRCTVGHTPTKCLSQVRALQRRVGCERTQRERGCGTSERNWRRESKKEVVQVLLAESVFHISDSVCAGRETSRDRRVSCGDAGCAVYPKSVFLSCSRERGLRGVS